MCYVSTRDSSSEQQAYVRLIGQRVQTLRESAGLAQDELADKAGLSRPYISRIERGVVPSPKVLDLDAVARALGTTVAELTSESGPPATTEALRREAQAILGASGGAMIDEIVRQAADYSPRDRQSLLDVLRVLAASFPRTTPDSPTA
jgi:transcriptional regulator with XRE-family HTH domain